MSENDAFHILALDGGGARGIYAAQVLARIEQKLGAPIREHVDLIAGTSTGAIIAGAAAVGIPMAEIVNLFKAESPHIFRKSGWGSPLFRSKYSLRPLERVIRGLIPDQTMGETPTPLIITSSDLSAGGVHVFKSRYLKELGGPYVRDSGVLLSDAILASCAAPIYFDPVPVGEFLLADGGLWANNPSMIALTEAVSRFERDVRQIHILSVGTGHSQKLYRRSRHWGFITGWGRQKLVAYMLGLQSQASTNMARLLLADRYLRLDPEIEDWALDDTKSLDNLIALATKDFTYQSEAIQDHLRGRAA